MRLGSFSGVRKCERGRRDEKLRSRGQRCPNANHGRVNAPVRYCPNCSGVVNEAIPIRKCNQEEHAKRRRDRQDYCVDCGEQLRKGI